MLPTLISADYAQEIADIDVRASEWPWTLNQYTQSFSTGDFVWGFLSDSVDNKILKAFAVYQQVLDEATLMNFAVHPDYQKQGLAQSLLQQTLQILKTDKAVQRCYLEVRESNLVAINVYKKTGFVIDGMRKNYYPVAGGRENAILMSIDLANFS